MQEFFTLKGEYETGRIWIDGIELLPDESLKLRNHSPDGFSWGYLGSGCAQLALAILLKLFPETFALQYYQRFKENFIAGLPQTDFKRNIPIKEWEWGVIREN
jgi:hypothetical protein